MLQVSTPADMKSLASCLNKLGAEGYTEDFKVVERGILALQSETIYVPGDIHVVNFYRYEGASDPADNSIVYAIETADGKKGTLIDAYGPYADENVTKFMEQVFEINKKSPR